MSDQLENDFYDRRRSGALPFIEDDTVEVIDGVYAAQRGTVVQLAYAEDPMQFLVDFGDGTDEYFAASSLALIAPADSGGA